MVFWLADDWISVALSLSHSKFKWSTSSKIIIAIIIDGWSTIYFILYFACDCVLFFENKLWSPHHNRIGEQQPPAAAAHSLRGHYCHLIEMKYMLNDDFYRFYIFDYSIRSLCVWTMFYYLAWSFHIRSDYLLF